MLTDSHAGESSAASGVAALVWLGQLAWVGAWSPRHFSEEAWRAAPRLGRHAMAEDYLRAHDVKSMSLADVVEDLGPADDGENWCVYVFFDDPASPTLPDARPGAEYELKATFGLDQRVASLSYYEKFARRSLDAFDRESWHARGPAGRLSMLRELEASGRCLGLTAEELQALLGTPDRRMRKPWISYTVANSLADYQILKFRADDTGRVFEASVYDG